MKWLWFNFSALIAFFAFVLHGAPIFPVVAGIGGAAVLNYLRVRKSRSA